MKYLYVYIICSFLVKGCPPGNENVVENPICNTDNKKEKFVVAKLKLIATDEFPNEEINGKHIISKDLSNLFMPSKCNCDNELPIVFDSEIYRIDTIATQKVFNHKDVGVFAGNTSKLKFWDNKSKSIENTTLEQAFLLPRIHNNVSEKLNKFITQKSKADSIYVLANTNVKYVLGNRTYNSFDNVDSLKAKIIQVYERNPKVNFVVLLNPPTIKEDVAVIIKKEDNIKKGVTMFIAQKTRVDSIFDLTGNRSKYTLDNKTYTAFDNVDSLKVKISQVYKRNPKLEFIVLLNPPAIKSFIVKIEGDGVKPTTGGSKPPSIRKEKWPGGKRTLSEVKNGTISEKEVKE